MDDKPWFKSKAKIGAILLALVGVVQPISQAIGHPVQVPLWVVEFLTALTGYGIRDAVNSQNQQK